MYKYVGGGALLWQKKEKILENREKIGKNSLQMNRDEI